MLVLAMVRSTVGLVFAPWGFCDRDGYSMRFGLGVGTT